MGEKEASRSQYTEAAQTAVCVVWCVWSVCGGCVVCVGCAACDNIHVLIANVLIKKTAHPRIKLLAVDTPTMRLAGRDPSGRYGNLPRDI